MSRVIKLVFLIAVSAAAAGQETSTVRYLENEGVMIAHGDTKILFDPLFENGYERYQRVPPSMRDAIFAGIAPYDGVDAVFISHFHGDHFSARGVLRLLQEREGDSPVCSGSGRDRNAQACFRRIPSLCSTE